MERLTCQSMYATKTTLPPSIEQPLNRDNMNTLDLIKAHGLALRQIPLSVSRLSEMRHHKEGNEIIKTVLKDMTPSRYAYHKKHHSTSADFELDDTRQQVTRLYSRSIRIPGNAGHWLCKSTNNDTSSRIEWSCKTDNLAPTLEESVSLFVSKINKKTP
jgi:hypothetical protein